MIDLEVNAPFLHHSLSTLQSACGKGDLHTHLIKTCTAMCKLQRAKLSQHVQSEIAQEISVFPIDI